MVSLSLQCYVWTLEYTINASPRGIRPLKLSQLERSLLQTRVCCAALRWWVDEMYKYALFEIKQRERSKHRGIGYFLPSDMNAGTCKSCATTEKSLRSVDIEREDIDLRSIARCQGQPGPRRVG